MDIYRDIRKYFTFKKSVYIYTPNFNYLFSCCLIFITSLYILDTNSLLMVYLVNIFLICWLTLCSMIYPLLFINISGFLGPTD